MHIVQIHLSEVPVMHYGGTERVVEGLCRAFLTLGHRVTLIALKGDGPPIPGVHFKDLSVFGKRATADAYQELIPEDADIVHFHLPFNQDEVFKSHPYVCTQHGNLRPDEDLKLLPKNTIFVSRNHAERHGRKSFVYNGLDPERIPLSIQSLDSRKYFAFLGKASLKRKGLHLAKPLAKKLGFPLHVGGKWGLGFWNTKYLGELDDVGKFKLLGGARGLLFPILWEEPFGLVLIEAMFAGTPVFALERGSVSEVLGLEGSQDLFIKASTIEELEEKMRNFHFSCDPMAYRAYASKYFTHMKMSEAYLSYYERVIRGEALL